MSSTKKCTTVLGKKTIFNTFSRKKTLDDDKLN